MLITIKCILYIYEYIYFYVIIEITEILYERRREVEPKRDRTEYFRQYRQKNAARLKEYQKEYRARNSEKYAFYALNYYLKKAKAERLEHGTEDTIQIETGSDDEI